MIAVDTNLLVHAHRDPWPCVHEFLAIVTHQRIYLPPTAVGEAMAAVSALTGAEIHEAPIAAICLGHGVDALWSSDRDFSWFPSLTVVNPLAGA